MSLTSVSSSFPSGHSPFFPASPNPSSNYLPCQNLTLESPQAREPSFWITCSLSEETLGPLCAWICLEVTCGHLSRWALTQGWLRDFNPALGSRGEQRVDLVPWTSGALLPRWAMVDSPESPAAMGGEGTLSVLNLLRKSWYLSLPLALTGISLHSLSN